MALQYFQLIFYAFIVAIVANYIRFKTSDNLNKLILVLSSLTLAGIDAIMLDSLNLKWILLIFIGTSSVCFKLYGGVIAGVFAWFILYMQTGENGFLDLVMFLIFSGAISLLANYFNKIKTESNKWRSLLNVNSRQLNVFREVSSSMQRTLNLQKLLQTVLTSVTAGHGLGFNRAIIFLINEEGTKLNGIMGTGPMTAEEGFATWENITKNRYKLQDLIEIKESEQNTDASLNERVKGLEISLDEPNFLYKTLESGEPLHIMDMSQEDKALRIFADQFAMTELAVFPLVNQGIKVGALIIDNPVNKKPITPADIESVLPLANQAATAIQHARLYAQIEEMALKDGLTGLFNQRAFQTFIGEHFTKDQQEPFSLIIIDIDFFKHFNDTNGHLLGNQVLIQLAEEIRNSIRDSDMAFRFGGEEFVILLPATGLENARTVAERVRANIESRSFPNGDKQPEGRVTISLGVAVADGHGLRNADELVEAADQALYEAKRTGKNKVVVYEKEREMQWN